MTDSLSSQSVRLRSALEPLVKKVQVDTSGSISFSIVNGSTCPVTGKLTGDWLRLRASLPTSPVGSVKGKEKRRGSPQLLLWNRRLTSTCRFARSGPKLQPVLLSDLPFDEASFSEAALQSAVEGLTVGLSVWSGKKLAMPKALDSEAAAFRPALDALTRKVEESGWAFKARANELAFDLYVPHEFRQALVRPFTEEEISISTEVHDCEKSSAVCGRGKALLLLIISGRVRMARACLSNEEGRSIFSLRTLLPTSASPVFLDHVLAAHSVAARNCVHELKVLDDKKIAQAYVASMGLK